MAVVQVTLNIVDTDLAMIVPAICAAWNLPASNANAKVALSKYCQQVVANYQGDLNSQAARLTAFNVANAIVIT